jgi:predicted nuclease of predicted toxin-antitoxin system
VIQIRAEDIRPKTIKKHVVSALKESVTSLEKGALVTIDPRRNRIRLLPLTPEKTKE